MNALMRVITFGLSFFIISITSASIYAHETNHALDVQLVTDEAEAVLTILNKQHAKQEILESDWQRVFNSEGYQRLKQREHSMQREFEDKAFKEFVLSEPLAKRENDLIETLARWRKADITTAATRALAYLPEGARIRAKIYPVIKPRENSFVFDVDNNPAIFLYLDPTVTRERFENTLSHELHHIGYGSNCPPATTIAAREKQSAAQQNLFTWLGGLGEGFAMLAAAGGPNIHPHQYSKKEDRERWDRDMQSFNQDLKKLENFFLDILDNKLSEAERNKVGFSFFGVQGPWYTVGWRMAVTIEQVYGRDKLLEVCCDNRQLLATYNQAAIKYNREHKTDFALYSSALLEKIAK